MSRFDHIEYDEIAKRDADDFKEICQKLETVIENVFHFDKTTIANKTKALNHLEICHMWIGKAIRDQQIARNSEIQVTSMETSKAVMKLIKFTKFGKTKLVPHITYTNKELDDPPKEKWDATLWVERGEDWYALDSYSCKTVLVVDRSDFIDAKECDD